MKSIPQFLIAAPATGAGKTTISLGLMALMVKKGYTVQPFKCGPDYIDTKYHEKICGSASINIDSYLASEEHVKQIYNHYSAGSDACIVEGMMGLFDGYDRDKGSSADLARILDLPIVLVIDAESAAYSVAALLKGYISFKKDIRIVGVIFNRVGSAQHYEMLKQACDDLQVECLGYLPLNEEFQKYSHYLGLDFSQKMSKDYLKKLVNSLEEHIDLSYLLNVTKKPVKSSKGRPPKPGKYSIMVAKNDESFSFIYQEHLDILKKIGDVRFFNPEYNRPLPKGIDLLYLPGGYPEKHADRLSSSDKMIDSIQQYVENGGRVIAECGGLIYLSQGLVADADKSLKTPWNIYPMAGVFNVYISTRDSDKKLSVGYRQFDYNGQHLKGHEFHYTQFMSTDDGAMLRPQSVAQVYDAVGNVTSSPVFRYKNAIASYTHLYWGEIDLMKLFE